MDDHGAFMFHRLPSIYIGDHRFTTIYIQLMVYMVVIYGLPIVEMVVYHGKPPQFFPPFPPLKVCVLLAGATLTLLGEISGLRVSLGMEAAKMAVLWGSHGDIPREYLKQQLVVVPYVWTLCIR